MAEIWYFLCPILAGWAIGWGIARLLIYAIDRRFVLSEHYNGDDLATAISNLGTVLHPADFDYKLEAIVRLLGYKNTRQLFTRMGPREAAIIRQLASPRGHIIYLAMLAKRKK